MVFIFTASRSLVPGALHFERTKFGQAILPKKAHRLPGWLRTWHGCVDKKLDGRLPDETLQKTNPQTPLGGKMWRKQCARSGLKTAASFLHHSLVGFSRKCFLGQADVVFRSYKAKLDERIGRWRSIRQANVNVIIDCDKSSGNSLH